MRRNPLVMFMCVELMLNAVTLTFVTFSRMLDDIDGQTVVVFVLVVAAAEVVVGLGIIVALLRKQPARHRRRHQRAEGLSGTAWRPSTSSGSSPRSRWPASSCCSCFGRKLGEPAAGWLATVACGGAFVATLVVFGGAPRRGRARPRATSTTSSTGSTSAASRSSVGFLVDPLSITMALFVTGVGALIHLYSIGYMHGDPDFSKFFVYLNLFVFSMLMLVLGSNMLVTFLGWEGVGACSYFLISFWFTKDANASAGKKAFVTNRIGDWGFMIAMFLAFATVGSLDYSVVLEQAPDIAPVTATAIALLLFVGACGKSAQIPLFVWLPDAMAGPTPVSALIHAATMVTAGVYLMTRVNPILAQGYDWAPDVIAWVGVITALFAATIAVAQNDIKKVLAYSTISQLGYMFLAVGVGRLRGRHLPHGHPRLLQGAAVPRLRLGDPRHARRAGHAPHGRPAEVHADHRRHLHRRLARHRRRARRSPASGRRTRSSSSPTTANPALWAIGLVTALLTAFYMSRQVFLVFFGEERLHERGRGASHEPVHPHESPWLMTVPLVVLAGLAVVGGVLNLPSPTTCTSSSDWLEPGARASNEAVLDVATEHQGRAWPSSPCSPALAGIALAAARVPPEAHRAGRAGDPRRGLVLRQHHHRLHGRPRPAGLRGRRHLRRRRSSTAPSTASAAAVRGSGTGLRVLQTGFVRSYALGVAVGVVGLLAYFLTRAGVSERAPPRQRGVARRRHVAAHRRHRSCRSSARSWSR